MTTGHRFPASLQLGRGDPRGALSRTRWHQSSEQGLDAAIDVVDHPPPAASGGHKPAITHR